jgi:hypothetical protein
MTRLTFANNLVKKLFGGNNNNTIDLSDKEFIWQYINRAARGDAIIINYAYNKYLVEYASLYLFIAKDTNRVYLRKPM